MDRAQAAADPETEVDVLRQIDEEYRGLYISRRLLNELMMRVQNSTIVNIAARTRITRCV